MDFYVDLFVGFKHVVDCQGQWNFGVFLEEFEEWLFGTDFMGQL